MFFFIITPANRKPGLKTFERYPILFQYLRKLGKNTLKINIILDIL